MRNLIAVGNPIPYIGSVGPISLPAPVRDFQLRPDFAVVHYWNDTGVWRHWFAPGLHESFGTLWPLTLAGMLAVAVFAIWRGREPILRVLGAFVIVTAVAYVFTPLTAAGEQGQPISFVWNVRYLAPGRGGGPGDPALPARAAGNARGAGRRSWPRSPCCWRSRSARWCSGSRATSRARWPPALLVVAFAVLVAVLRSRGVLGPAARRRVRVALAAVALGVAVAAGYGEQDHYLTHRYENTGQVQDLADALRWSRDVRDARIAVAGIRARVHAVPVLRHRPLEPGAVAGRPRPARLLPADPELPRSGGGRSTPAATPTSSPPSTPTCRMTCATRPRGAGRSPTPTPTSSCATGP